MMLRRDWGRWAAAAALAAAITPTAFAQDPVRQSAGPSPAVVWKRSGTTSPDPLPPSAGLGPVPRPAVVRVSAELPPGAAPVVPASPLPSRVEPVSAVPPVLPPLVSSPLVSPAAPTDQWVATPEANPVSGFALPRDVTGVVQPTTPSPMGGGVPPPAAAETPSPARPGAAGGAGSEQGGAGGPGPNVQSSQPSVGTALGGSVPPSGTPDEKKFHGHRYPIQPLAPPGAAPVPPTGPGYYTLFQFVEQTPGEKPPRWPYPRGGPFPGSFSEVDFTYLDQIPFEDREWAEKLHRVPLGDSWLFSTGGEFRGRYNNETNTRLTGKDDVYMTYRTRVYGDLWYEDVFRTYVEFYYGDSAWQDVAPYPRDVNQGDFQQLFVDLKLGEVDGNPVYARGGRQEMAYGSQRLISPNDWGDNRTRFDGVKTFYRSSTFDADAFAVRPTLVSPTNLDTWDVHQTFSGAWFTWKPKAGTFVDLYYLDLDNVNHNVARGQFRSGGYNVSTFGSRYYGRFDNGLLVDVEGMLQTGHWADQSILAQAFHTYAGWYFKDVWATPTVWVGHDYASGDPNPNETGQHRTFNQLFQFGHYYYGFVDITGGQNIHDFNVQAYAYPLKWLTTGAQYHVFRLASDTDALYNASGSVLRQDRTGKAGDDVGSELDLLVNVHLTDHQDLFFNYCHFYTGSFLRATGNATNSVPLDYTYVQYSFRW